MIFYVYYNDRSNDVQEMLPFGTQEAAEDFITGCLKRYTMTLDDFRVFQGFELRLNPVERVTSVKLERVL